MSILYEYCFLFFLVLHGRGIEMNDELREKREGTGRTGVQLLTPQWAKKEIEDEGGRMAATGDAGDDRGEGDSLGINLSHEHW